MRAESGKRELIVTSKQHVHLLARAPKREGKAPARMTEESADVPKELLGKHVRFLSFFPPSGEWWTPERGRLEGGGWRRRSRFPKAIGR